MNEKQPVPVTKEDIRDIIELVRPLAASQKKDILAEIDNTRKEIPTDQNINGR
jgi:hypothetical protein